MKIGYLRDYPQLYPTVARWIFEEFRYGFEDETFEGWLEILTHGQQDRSMTSFVVFQGEEPIATASFDLLDLPPKDNLSPWLASVYTKPEFRGQGIAGKLLVKVDQEARMRGFSRLHLHTTDKAPFYIQRGWLELEQFEYWGREITLMAKDL